MRDTSLEQGQGHGQSHLALKLNLLAEVNQLFSAFHALNVFIAVLDELQRKIGDSEVQHCLLESVLFPGTYEESLNYNSWASS